MIFFLFFSQCQRDTDVSDLVGEIRKRAGRNSVKINRDVKGADNASPGTESTHTDSHHVFQ